MAHNEHKIKEPQGSCTLPINRFSNCFSKPLWITISLYYIIPEHVGWEINECEVICHLVRDKEHLVAEDEIWWECTTKL